nr:translation initiation factor IF-2-like [Anas platyrhynchos]|eukprot:XP_027324162.1 translation initiation factor IF-2-like isoform X2 [Anas platyrhynchos]
MSRAGSRRSAPRRNGGGTRRCSPPAPAAKRKGRAAAPRPRSRGGLAAAAPLASASASGCRRRGPAPRRGRPTTPRGAAASEGPRPAARQRAAGPSAPPAPPRPAPAPPAPPGSRPALPGAASLAGESVSQNRRVGSFGQAAPRYWTEGLVQYPRGNGRKEGGAREGLVDVASCPQIAVTRRGDEHGERDFNQSQATCLTTALQVPALISGQFQSLIYKFYILDCHYPLSIQRRSFSISRHSGVYRPMSDPP